jgi:hypothetical protein
MNNWLTKVSANGMGLVDHLFRPGAEWRLFAFLGIVALLALIEAHQIHLPYGYVVMWFWRLFLLLACVATYLLASAFRHWLLRAGAVVISVLVFWNAAFLDEKLAMGEFRRLCSSIGGIYVFEHVVLQEDQFVPDTGLPVFYLHSARDMGLPDAGYKFSRITEERIKGRWGVFRVYRSQLVTNSGKPLVELRSVVWGGGGPPTLAFGRSSDCPDSKRFEVQDMIRAAFVPANTLESTGDGDVE